MKCLLLESGCMGVNPVLCILRGIRLGLKQYRLGSRDRSAFISSLAQGQSTGWGIFSRCNDLVLYKNEKSRPVSHGRDVICFDY